MWKGIKLSKGKFSFHIKEKNSNGNLLKEKVPEKSAEISVLGTS